MGARFTYSKDTLSLVEAVEGFERDRVQMVRVIREHQFEDPGAFLRAAQQMLVRGRQGAGFRYLASLMAEEPKVLRGLLEPLMPLEEAIALARQLAQVVPNFDALLARRLVEVGRGEVGDLDRAMVLRTLILLPAISDLTRTLPHLIQLLRHPSTHVRLKLIHLMGRANYNRKRTEQYLASKDPRMRAAVIRSLWPWAVRARLTLEEAAHEADHRVAVNACVGLCRVGDAQAAAQLAEYAIHGSAAEQKTALWGMGHASSPVFLNVLERHSEHENDGVRAMALRSLEQLRIALTPAPVVEVVKVEKVEKAPEEKLFKAAVNYQVRLG